MKGFWLLLLLAVAGLVEQAAAEDWIYTPAKDADLEFDEFAVRKAIAQSQARTATQDARIAYGQLAVAGQFPSVVSLQSRPGTTYFHYCGATLIAPTLLLTAAHCIHNSTGDIVLPAGALLGGINLSSVTNFKEYFTIKGSYIPKVYDHSNWQNNEPVGDICVLEMSGKSALPPASLLNKDPRKDDWVTSVGWGVDQNYNTTKKRQPNLRYADLKISTGEEPCDWTVPGMICSTGSLIAPDQWPSICQGDSGGAHFLGGTNIQVGVNSFVTNAAEGCGRNSFNGVTSVAAHADWITKVFTNLGYKAKDVPYVDPPPFLPPAPSPSPIPSPSPLPVSGNSTSPVGNSTAGSSNSTEVSPPPFVTFPENPDNPPDIFASPSPSPFDSSSQGLNTAPNNTIASKSVCLTYDTDGYSNKRYIYPKAVRPAFKAANYAACAQACLDTAKCKTFQFRKHSKRCSLFWTTKNSKMTVDRRFRAGYVYCAELVEQQI